MPSPPTPGIHAQNSDEEDVVEGNVWLSAAQHLRKGADAPQGLWSMGLMDVGGHGGSA